MTAGSEAPGLRAVINATGPWTKMGNSSLSDAVIEAMNEAARVYLPIAELQVAAGHAIAEATGAEAGYATAGAAAGITLCVAACMAGLDADRIISLPHVDGPPNTVVMFQQHRGYYDFAIRATGARLRLVDAAADGCLEELSAALDGDVACVFYDCTGMPYKDQADVPPLRDVVRLAHKAGLRVIVDASMALPPAENLSALVATGADALIFTASKAMQGPAASGFIACREAMVRSIAIQNQDIDILAETGGGGAITEGRFMGLGRGLKVGKEQICGMLAALRAYQERDHAADQARWLDDLSVIDRSLASVAGVSTRWLTSNEGRAPYLLIGFEGELAAVNPEELSRALLEGNPRIFVAAHHGNVLWLGAECLHAGEADVVAQVLPETIRAAAASV